MTSENICRHSLGEYTEGGAALELTVYGLRLTSNRELPELSTSPPLSSGLRSDWNIAFGMAPQWDCSARLLRYEHKVKDADGLPLLTCWQTGAGQIELQYADGVRFFLDPDQSAIWVTWPETLDYRYTVPYLLGPVLGFALRLRGSVCLHASGIVMDGKCLLFAGPSGSGKSTIAAALARLGAEVLTDDVACLSEEGGDFFVSPGYRSLRLLDTSAALIDVSPDSLPQLGPGWDKRYLPLDNRTLRFRSTPTCVSRIFFLGGREALSEPARIRDLPGQEVVSRLATNTFTNYLLDTPQRAKEFPILGRLARSVSVQELTLNRDGARLFDACRWIAAQP